ncbi:MAG: PilZ domain-containing protein [Oligoflexales bacterium]|nr:PilZ domain-containing protein [Oligoflexales bacterium]
MNRTTVPHDPYTVLSMLNAMEEHLNRQNKGNHDNVNSLDAPRIRRISDNASQNKKTFKNLSQRKRAKRHPFAGEVLIVKNNRYLKGRAKNISKSGIFVSASERVFKDHEAVRVIIKPFGSGKTYRLVARIARFSNSPLSESKGYGLRFIYPKNTLRYS